MNTTPQSPASPTRLARRSVILAGAALLVALPCRGQVTDTSPPAVGPDEAMELFRRHGLELRAARADFRTAVGRASQEAAYPNPTASLFREDLSRGADEYSENTFSLNQTLEWPGRTLARSRTAERATAAARSAFHADSLRLVLEARRAYLRAAEAERRAAVLREAAAVVRDAVDDGEVRRAEGDISGYQLRRLELERVRLDGRLAAARIDRDAARRELATRLLPGSDTTALATRGLPAGRPPPVERERALSAALRRPEVMAGRHAAEAAGAEAAAARLGRIPDLQLTGGYKTQSDDLDGAVLGLSLSLPVFDRRSGEVRGAEARASAAAIRLELRRRTARNDVLGALDRYRSVRRRTRVLEDELPGMSEELLESVRTSYAEGEMEPLGLLDGTEAYLESRLTALELRAELWLAFYELSRAMGGTPDGSESMAEPTDHGGESR